MLKEAIDHEINARTSTNDAIFCPKACAYLPGLIPDWAGAVIMEVDGEPGVTQCFVQTPRDLCKNGFVAPWNQSMAPQTISAGRS